MINKFLERKPAEDSLFLRMLWLAQTFTCFFLIAQVDPEIAFIDLFGLKLPLLFIYFWTAVCGSFLSYNYRHEKVKWLEWLGLIPIAITCTWFTSNLHQQLVAGGNIDLLLPTVHLVAGLYVSHSFELRSRFDFNFSLVLSLLLVCCTATIGKGAIFGLGMFAFIVLAATLLLLDCEARTFGSVQARNIDNNKHYRQYGEHRNTEKTANLIFPTFVLLILSIVFFLAAPRAESLADQVSAKVYSFLRNMHKEPVVPDFTKRIRNPFHPERRRRIDEEAANDLLNAAEKMEAQKRAPQNGKQSKTNNGSKTESKTESPSSETQNKNAAAAAKSKLNSANKNTAQGKKEGAPKQEADSKSKGISKAGHENAGEKGSLPHSSKRLASSKADTTDGGNSSRPTDKNALENALDKIESDSLKRGPAKGKGDGSGDKSKGKTSDGKAKEKPNKEKDKQEIVYNMPDTLDADSPGSTDNQVVFRVATNRTVFFRQGAFDKFDGRQWHISGDIPSQDLLKSDKNTYMLKDIFPLALPASVPAIRLTQKFHIVQNLGRKIIFAGSPFEIIYPGTVITADTCGNLKGSWVLVKGLEYTVSSDEALYDVKSMRQEGFPNEAGETRLREGFTKFLQIPNNQSERVFELSQKIAGLQENWFVQAERICNYLRTSYSYNKDPKYKNTNAKNSVDRFLFESKTGDCKDFASAFVVLCRASGIPARMVVGFSPGDFDPATGTREIKLSDSHAWGEIYFPSSGWVPFDSTPGGTMPSRESEEERYFTTLGQKVKSKLSSHSAASEGIKLPAFMGGRILVINLWDLVKLLPFLITILVLAGPFSLLLKKAIKNIHLPRRMHPASKIYFRMLKDLKRLGVQNRESQTAGELLAEIKEKIESQDSKIKVGLELNIALEEFVETYNRTYYGSEGNLKELENKRQAVARLVKTKG